MKHFVILFFLGWTLQVTAPAQGFTEFRITFLDPLPLPNIPRGSAALSGDYFQARLLSGFRPAESCRILEMLPDSSFAPVFVCANVIPVHEYYWYDEAWVLTELQKQSLSEERWYAEMTFGSRVYLGRIALVPEPSSAPLLLLGLGLLAANRLRRSHFAEQRAGGDGGMSVLFRAGRLGPAAPQRERSPAVRA